MSNKIGKYNIGDEVVVRKDLKVGERYGEMFFVDTMENAIGKKVKIENKLLINGGTIAIYMIDKYNSNFYWTDEMFEDIDSTCLNMALELLNISKEELEYKFEKDFLK